LYGVFDIFLVGFFGLLRVLLILEPPGLPGADVDVGYSLRLLADNCASALLLLE